MAEFDDEAAFPYVSHGAIADHQVSAVGLTKRELFAAMAMQGELASQNERLGYWYDGRSDVLAERSVAHADALLSRLRNPAQSTETKEERTG